MRIGLLFVLVLSFTVVGDQAQARPTCPTLNKMWFAKYHREFKVRWPLKRFNCPSPTSKVAEIFYYLDTIKFHSTPDGYSPPFYQWSKQYPRGVFYKKSRGNLAQAAMLHLNGNVYFLTNIFKYDIVNNIQLFVHEASHAKPGDPKHVICTRGAFAGTNQPYCDAVLNTRNYFTGSGYAYGYGFLDWLIHASYGHDLSIQQARRSMEFMKHNNFNSIQ